MTAEQLREFVAETRRRSGVPVRVSDETTRRRLARLLRTEEGPA